jgi:ABC-type nitrate/sulfonate/bicarbonate transport system substrate-binding protein
MLLFGRSLLDERPEVGERFIAAYLEAVELYAEGKSAANVAALARHTGLEPGLVERACWMPLRADGRIDTPSVLAFQRWAVERGYLDAVEPVERFWEPRFVDAAAARERP